MSFKSYDIAERLKNSFGTSSLFFTMNPAESAVIIPEDAEGGNPYSYYNIPYTIVPEYNLFDSETELCLGGVLINGICCPEGSTGLFPIGDPRQGRCCQDCSESSPEDGTSGFIPAEGEDYCVSDLGETPHTTGTMPNFGTQAFNPPITFSYGVWR